MGRYPKSPGLKSITLKLGPADLAALDAIAAEAGRGGLEPTRTRAVRWSIAELAARLELARRARGAAPVFTPPGPLVPPPD